MQEYLDGRHFREQFKIKWDLNKKAINLAWGGQEFRGCLLIYIEAIRAIL